MCARYSQNIFIPWQDKETSAEKPVEPKLFFFGEGGPELKPYIGTGSTATQLEYGSAFSAYIA